MWLEIETIITRRDGTSHRITRGVEHHDRKAIDALVEDVRGEIQAAATGASRVVDRAESRPERINLGRGEP